MKQVSLQRKKGFINNSDHENLGWRVIITFEARSGNLYAISAGLLGREKK